MAIQRWELGTDSHRMACDTPFGKGGPCDRACDTVGYKSQQHGVDRHSDTDMPGPIKLGTIEERGTLIAYLERTEVSTFQWRVTLFQATTCDRRESHPTTSEKPRRRLPSGAIRESWPGCETYSTVLRCR